MIMKKIKIKIISCGCVASVERQQQPNYSQFSSEIAAMRQRRKKREAKTVVVYSKRTRKMKIKVYRMSAMANF
jgi:ATP sulfurylase